MPKILVQGKVLEMDKQMYLSALDDISKNVHWIARLVCEDHRYGSINTNGSQQTKFLRGKSELQQAMLQAIEDHQLRKYFDSLEMLAEKVEKQDTIMIEWLATYYHIPSLNSPEERRRFNRKLSRERRKAADHGSGLLGWVNESEWRKLETEFLKLVADINSVSSKISERIRFLLGG